MEEIKDECPTEILVELKEDSFVPSEVNSKYFQNSLYDHISDGCLKNEGNLALEKQSEDCKSILDMSPFRIKGKIYCANTRNIDLGAKQGLKIDKNIDDCPTGILVDLPYNSNSPKPGNFFSKTPWAKAASKMSNSQSNTVIEAADSEREVYLNSGIKNCSFDISSPSPLPVLQKRLTDAADNDHCSKSVEEENKSLASKSGFKTPSPESMSLISSEVSKVINNLNTSVVFDEDDLLNEEILPIPLNFDDLDASDGEEKLPKVEVACENQITDSKVSISVQTQDSSDKNGGNIGNDINSQHNLNEHLKISSESKDFSSSLSAEIDCSPIQYNSTIQLYNTKKITSDENSKKYSSCDIKSDSFDISNISSSTNNSTDDVFNMSHIADEDKENAPVNKRVLPKKNSQSCKTFPQKSFISEMTGSRETLKNLSKFHNKQKTSQMKMSINSKVLQPASNAKLQSKKTVSAMESRTVSKRMSLSNTFHFQSSKEFMSSFQKPGFGDQNTSFHPNPVYKSYVKQESMDKMKSSFATPSKRYSISTPLKGAVLKPQFTPLLQGSQNHALPRFTPQSVGSSRLSFSKSLQPSSKISQFSTKQQCSPSLVTSKVNQPSLARLNQTAKPCKSFVRGALASNSKIIEKNALSTSNVKRFCSKLSLPSPLSAVQDKKLARALFSSDP